MGVMGCMLVLSFFYRPIFIVFNRMYGFALRPMFEVLTLASPISPS